MSFVIVCIDIKVDVFLNDCRFCKKQTFNVLIQIIILFFKVRNFNIKMYKILKYIISDIYLFKIKNEKKIISILRCEIYLIDDLKINLLFNNNIINFKKIVIDIINKSIIINNINVIII